MHCNGRDFYKGLIDKNYLILRFYYISKYQRRKTNPKKIVTRNIFSIIKFNLHYIISYRQQPKETSNNVFKIEMENQPMKPLDHGLVDSTMVESNDG